MGQTQSAPSIDWDGWSGFQGEGTYVILNRKFLLSLQMDHYGEISTGYASILDYISRI